MGKHARPKLQVATIGFHHGRVCLVTSRKNKDWVIPKGSLKRGKTAREMALQEAWEEAGLVGTLRREPLLDCLFEKAGRPQCVTVYVMDVAQVARDWPERVDRQRRWMLPDEAVAVVKRPQLRQVLSVATQQQNGGDAFQLNELLISLLRQSEEHPRTELRVKWMQSKTTTTLSLAIRNLTSCSEDLSASEVRPGHSEAA